MDRRAAAAGLAVMVLAGCGGGGGAAGGGSGAIAVPEPTPAPPASAVHGPDRRVGRFAHAALRGQPAAAVPAKVDLRRRRRGPELHRDFRPAARRSGGRNAWINIFWMGTNNPTQPAQVKADIAASVAALAPGNDRFLVLPVINKARPEEMRGGTSTTSIVQLNSDLAWHTRAITWTSAPGW